MHVNFVIEYISIIKSEFIANSQNLTAIFVNIMGITLGMVAMGFGTKISF